MTPIFYIAHRAPGRTRIRWAGDASEKASVFALAAEIENLNADIIADPRITTGSIIIQHEGLPWPSVETQLADRLSITILAGPPTVKGSGAAALYKDINRLDGALKHLNLDFDSVTLLMLSAAAITQALRGQVMSSSVSFLWYAFTLAMMARGKAASDPDPTSDATE